MTEGKFLGFLVAMAALALTFVAVVCCAQPEAQPAEEPAPGVVITMVEPPELGNYWPAKCVRVVDGDTIDVEVRKVYRIRLNVWCPETKGPQKEAGIRAKEFMRKLAEGKPGVVVIPWHDEAKDELTLNRFLGRFIVNGVDVGKEMVHKKLGAETKEKLAEMYPE